MITVKCKQCPKKFTHPTQQKADAALAMHIGRKHENRIVTPKGPRHTGVLQPNGNGKLHAVAALPKSRSRRYITGEQSDGITSFIRANQGNFSNKTECLKAALASVGAENAIKLNSTAVNRYFKKAGAVRKPYTRRVKPQAVESNVKINFCPCCGYDMQALATGMAMAAHLKG